MLCCKGKMKILLFLKKTIKENKRLYLSINVICYGLFLIGVGLGILGINIRGNFEFVDLLFGFGSFNILGGASITFLDHVYYVLIMTTLYGVLIITFSSYIIPFTGVLICFIRMFTWGLVNAPIEELQQTYLVVNIVTVFIQGQAFILSTLGIYLSSKWILFPKSMKFNNRWVAIKEGVKLNFELYFFIIVLLIFSAGYEVFSDNFIIPLFY